MVRPTRVERLVRPTRVERLVRPTRVERLVRPTRVERLVRPTRVERLVRLVRFDCFRDVFLDDLRVFGDCLRGDFRCFIRFVFCLRDFRCNTIFIIIDKKIFYDIVKSF